MAYAVQVDWSALAAVLMDRCPEPMLVFDREMKIQLFNEAGEKLFGRTRYEVFGRTFAEVCAIADSDAHPPACFDQVLRGIKRSCDSRTHLPDGRQVLIEWDLKAVGYTESAAVLATMRTLREDSLADSPPRFDGDLHYEIETSPARFGFVRQAWTGDSRRDAQLVDHYCYQTLRRRSAPCVGCPALESQRGSTDRTAVLRLREGNKLSIVTTQKLTADRARMSVRDVDESILNDLVAAKANELAERSKLSTREREVLQLLLSGCSQEEISERLVISPRTVKFHQANVLAKLGADSRVDLLRLIF